MIDDDKMNPHLGLEPISHNFQNKTKNKDFAEELCTYTKYQYCFSNFVDTMKDMNISVISMITCCYVTTVQCGKKQK